MRRVGDLEGAARAGPHLQRKTIHAAEQDRPDVARRRQLWKRVQLRADARRLIFIDETPLHGWGKDEHDAAARAVAALGVEDVRCSTVVDGAVNADIIEAFVEQVLVPELRPGDIVVMDNFSSLKNARTRALIESAGARLDLLPPCSPDLNPIEMVFAKV